MFGVMKRSLGIVTALACAFAFAGTARAEKINMTEGLWEMTGELEMNGQKMANPAIQHCITKKDLVPQTLPDSQVMKCKTDQKVTASTVNWTTSCTIDGGGLMKMVGEITYTGKKFSGLATMTMKIPNAGEQKSSLTMSGKYIGACKK